MRWHLAVKSNLWKALCPIQTLLFNSNCCLGRSKLSVTQHKKKLLFEIVLMKTFLKNRWSGNKFPPRSPVTVHLYLVASKRVQKQEEGQVTIERTKSICPVGVSQANHFNEPFYKVDTHNISIVSTSIETGKYSRLGYDYQINQQTFLMQ